MPFEETIIQKSRTLPYYPKGWRYGIQIKDPQHLKKYTSSYQQISSKTILQTYLQTTSREVKHDLNTKFRTEKDSRSGENFGFMMER